MVGRTKKQKIFSAIFIVLFVCAIAFGIVSYSYTTLTGEDITEATQEKDDEDNFVHTYMESIYDRLQNGNN